MTEQMTMAVFTGPGQLEYRQIARPEPKPEQVLVRLKAAAICTVEQRAWKGMKSGLDFPFVGGHEVSGEVVEVGDQVLQDFKPGDKIVLGVGSDCGACYYCRRGENQRCLYAWDIYGRYVEQYDNLPGLWGFSEFRVVNQNELFKAEGDAPFTELALAEPLACVIHSMRMLDIELADDMVIIGAGPMGMLNLLVANRLGARTIVSELQPKRLEKAAKLGANEVINATEENAVEQVKLLTDGRGAEFIIAAIGLGQVNEQALNMLARGGRFVLFASAHPAKTLELDPNRIHSKEYIISGTGGKDPDDLRIAAKLLATGMVDVGPLVEAELPFNQLEEALDLASQPDTYRVVVTLD
jgi:2-desacetyl-2-hydroxyethyl bacteriochlorophyllide A dehydrogenase